MFAVNRPITVLMVALALTLFGWQSLRQLETSLLPEIEYPEFVIVTEFKGGSPEEIEQAITIHLEEALSSLPSLQDIVSSSRDGLSVITVQFHWNIDPRFTLLRIREKIDAVYDRFPRGTVRPYILDFNPGSMPVMELILTGEASLTELGNFTRDVLKPRFSQVPGIAGANVIGSPEQAVRIEMDPTACARLGITSDRIIQSVQNNLLDKSLSSVVKVGYAEYPMTVEFPLNAPEELAKIPIENRENIPVRLGDVARVRKKPLAHQSLVYHDTTESLLIQLFKESGASTVRATRSALDLVKEISQTYPEMRLSVIKNRGEFVRQAIAGLKQSILLGALLAFLVILFFLQDVRYALLLSMVIPVSLLFAFNALYLHGISLNIMTLGGLALGLGLIVDNGIVVVESIFLEMEKERSPRAVLRGVKKVSRAITGSTLTTIAIFLPIVYVEGYAAALFKQQALTISYTLVISLLAAIFLIPAAFYYFVMKRTKPRRRSAVKKKQPREFSLFGPLYRVFQKVYGATEHTYHNLLIYALDHKKRTIGLLLLLFVIAVFVFEKVPKRYWPAVPSDRVEMKIAVPATIPFDIIRDKTERSLRNLMRLSEVVHVTTRLVDPLKVSTRSFQDLSESPGSYYVYFSISLDRAIRSFAPVKDRILRRIVLPRDHLSIYQPTGLSQEMGGLSTKNFVVYITEESTGSQEETAERLGDFLKTIDYCKEVSVEKGGEQLVKAVTLDPLQLLFNDITPDVITGNLILHTGEKIIGSWQEKLRGIPVIAAWDTAGTKDLSRLLGEFIEPGKSLYRTEQLVSLRDTMKVREIKRVNRRPVIAVQANVPTRKLRDIADRVSEWYDSHTDAGVTVTIAGESVRIAESFQNLFLAFGMAVVFVYFILAAQFESFVHPLNIMLTVPMGLVGATLGLVLFGQSLNVISLIGIVMLTGIGVNDAIIKVDYMNYLSRREKIPLREAVLRTSKEKFRPVIMTTLTTIVAMLPLAFGFGGNVEMNRPLAITIIGGLSITTVLTLIITPVMYEIGESLRARRRMFGKK